MSGASSAWNRGQAPNVQTVAALRSRRIFVLMNAAVEKPRRLHLTPASTVKKHADHQRLEVRDENGGPSPEHERPTGTKVSGTRPVPRQRAADCWVRGWAHHFN